MAEVLFTIRHSSQWTAYEIHQSMEEEDEGGQGYLTCLLDKNLDKGEKSFGLISISERTNVR